MKTAKIQTRISLDVIEEKLMRADNMQKSLAEIIESTITDSIVTTLASLADGRMSLHRVAHIPPSEAV